MEGKEQELIATIEEKIKSETGKMPTKDEVKALSEQITALQAKYEEQTGTLLGVSEALEAMKAAKTMVTDVKAEIKAAAKQLSENFESGKFDQRIKVKTVGDMSTSNITGAGAQPYNIKNTDLVVALPLAFQICNVWTTDTPVVDASMDSAEGGAAATSETSAKSQADYNIYGTTYTPVAINAYTTVSRQMMKNLSYLENQITTRLNKLVMEKISIQALEGNGSTPILKGAYTFGTAFSCPAAYGSKYTSPSLYHVLLVAVGQVKGNNYTPNAIVLNPSDAIGLKLAIIEKQINLPELLVSNGQLFVSGVPVHESSNLTAGTFVVGDFALSNLVLQGAYELYIDPYSGLKNNMVTILGEQMVTHYIAKADTGAFVKGTIASALSDLTKV